MLTQEVNDRYTRVGPGTPTGDLMRRYWHPIGAGSPRNDIATKKTRPRRAGGEAQPGRRVARSVRSPTRHGLGSDSDAWIRHGTVGERRQRRATPFDHASVQLGDRDPGIRR